MLDGRVKTLHPKIHAGILHDRQNRTRKNEMSKNKFPAIDLIVVIDVDLLLPLFWKAKKSCSPTIPSKAFDIETSSSDFWYLCHDHLLKNKLGILLLLITYR